MNEQIFTFPLSPNETLCIHNPNPILFDQELMKINVGIQPFLNGRKLGALTLIYLEFGLPMQAARRAAEADLSDA
jgi:hypothetical protein